MRNRLLLLVLWSSGILSSARAAEAPLPYATEVAFNLNFEQPIAIVTPSGETNRLFIIEKPGRIIVIPDLAHPARRTFLDLTARVGSDDVEQGVLAVAFHPDYQHNRQFYVWYTSCHYEWLHQVREDRLARFTVSATDPNIAEPASEQILFAQADEAPNHNGGELAFGPDGYLYLSLGDEGGANDEYDNGQHIDRDYFSGILRLDVDQHPGNVAPNPHPAVHAGTYSVPRDNPFVGATTFNGRPVDAAHVRTEFWAVGLRNPWRMSFDPMTGALWCGDVGQERLEEVNLIKRGGNYGWHLREGKSPFRDQAPAGAKLDGPMWAYPHALGLCITGGLVSHGARYPDLEGKYLFADYLTGRLWALMPAGDKPVDAGRVRQVAHAENIVSFGRDPRNGDVLLASLWAGKILRLVRNPAAAGH